MTIVNSIQTRIVFCAFTIVVNAPKEVGEMVSNLLKYDSEKDNLRAAKVIKEKLPNMVNIEFRNGKTF